MKSPRHTSRQSGAAIIIVMAVLALVCTLLFCSHTVLNGLKAELKLVEERQQKKFAPDVGTNRLGQTSETKASQRTAPESR